VGGNDGERAHGRTGCLREGERVRAVGGGERVDSDEELRDDKEADGCAEGVDLQG